MKYDFTSIMDRHGRDAIAVDGLRARTDGTDENPGMAPMKPREGSMPFPCGWRT